MTQHYDIQEGTQAAAVAAVSSATIAAHLEDLLRQRQDINARLAELEDQTRRLLASVAADEAAFDHERRVLATNPQFQAVLQRSRERAQQEGTLSLEEVQQLLN